MHSFGLFAIVPTAAKYMACARLAEQADARLQLTLHERARSVSRGARYAGYFNAYTDVWPLEVLEAFHAGKPTPERPYQRPMRYRFFGRNRYTGMRGVRMWPKWRHAQGGH